MIIGQIEAPHFVAGFEIEGEKRTFAPIISYMKDWSLFKIISYSCGKGWNVSTIDPNVIFGPPE